MTDFTSVDAAEADFDAKMEKYKDADAALGAAIGARDTAQAELEAKEQAVRDAEEVKADADAAAEAALNVYLAELDQVGITKGAASAASTGRKKRGRKPKAG